MFVKVDVYTYTGNVYRSSIMTITGAHVMTYYLHISVVLTFWYARMYRMTLYVLWGDWIGDAEMQIRLLGLQPIVSMWNILEISPLCQYSRVIGNLPSKPCYFIKASFRDSADFTNNSPMHFEAFNQFCDILKLSRVFFVVLVFRITPSLVLALTPLCVGAHVRNLSVFTHIRMCAPEVFTRGPCCYM